jgi:hypothetical protein
LALRADSATAQAQTFNFQVCNQSGVSASVAVSSLTAVEAINGTHFRTSG